MIINEEGDYKTGEEDNSETTPELGESDEEKDNGSDLEQSL